MAAEEQHLQGIAQLMVQENILDNKKALEYQHLAQSNKQSFAHYLVANNILQAEKIAYITAQNFGFPLLDLESMEPEFMPISLVNEKLIMRHAMLPIYSHGNYLFLATDDPSQHASLKEIQFHTGLHTYPIVVETNKLHRYIEKLIHEKENQGLNDYVEGSHGLESLEIGQEEVETDTDRASQDDAPVVKFINKILIDAVKKSVSDIHFEPYEKEYRIRYRLDGILQEVAAPPINLASRITSRIKVMSNLDISERRVPQDGRFKMKLTKARAIDFRVSTCPTTGGEKIVMRILDPSSTKVGVDALGFNALQMKQFLLAIEKPQGMILVTGPTGSGKTVTLYTALNILNTKEVNISTAEDPVEIKVPGINQVSMNPKAGLNFSNSLRAFLRQDPDIIMVGEIRDYETAEIALKAAQTGHLVLSTLHTNSAAETLTRLMNMGIPSFNIASSVTLIIAQRLVRKLCENCKTLRDDITPKGLIELGFSEQEIINIKIYKPSSCPLCTGGYKGRVGLFEVLMMSKAIGQIIMSGGNSLDIFQQAKADGMITVYQSGLEKIKQGITSIEEVNRVTVE